MHASECASIMDPHDTSMISISYDIDMRGIDGMLASVDTALVGVHTARRRQSILASI